jgi:hypothetical protein
MICRQGIGLRSPGRWVLLRWVMAIAVGDRACLLVLVQERNVLHRG